MLCLKSLKTESPLFSLKKLGGFGIAEATADEEQVVEKALAKWRLEITYTKSFQANNDGGIDDELGSSTDTEALKSDNCILHGGRLIGFCVAEKLFMLNDIRTYTQYDEKRDEGSGPYGEDIVYSTRYTVIPDSLDLDEYLHGRCEIGSEFIAYSGIYSLTIPSYVEKIDSRAFYNCRNLSSVYMDECAVEEIGDSTFSESPIKSLTLPRGIKRIGAFAFTRCPLCDLELPEGLEKIGKDAFKKCTGIDNLIKPRGVGAYNVFDGIKMNLFYKGGTDSFLEDTRAGRLSFRGSDITLYCYSESKPELTELAAPAELGITAEGVTLVGYWHYLDGKATPWG